MYPVSDEFAKRVQENSRIHYWSGRISAKNGKVYEFGSEDIVKESGYISAQCCGNTEIELGTVYSSELAVTIFSDIDRYTLEGATIEMFYHLRLPNDLYETVPMGIFEISEANRAIRCLEIKAYDYMLRFEKNFNGYESVGNAWDFLMLCCKACDVETVHDRQEIEKMLNGSVALSIYPENDIETYRDVLYFLGQVLGGFFVMNREGRLQLRKYGMEPVLEIMSRHRFSSSFSDFITRYTAVSSTNMRTQIAEYYGLEQDSGLTMNLGINPFLQFGLQETREELCRNILMDLSQIAYVPFDSSTIGNPALELGDVLCFSGGHADAEQSTCITSVIYNIGGKQTLKCVGKNPWLAQAKSKNDKNISGLLSQIESGKISLYTFTNASAYRITDADAKIISIEFAASEETDAQFLGQIIIDVQAEPAEITGTAKGTIAIPQEREDEQGENSMDVNLELPVTVSVDGRAEVQIIYELNDEKILTYQPKESWGSGYHTLSLYYPLKNVMPHISNFFHVYLRMSGGSGNVETGGAIASVSGQALAATSSWDGRIELEQEIGRNMLVKTMAPLDFSESVSYQMIGRMENEVRDRIGKVSMRRTGNMIDLEGEGAE